MRRRLSLTTKLSLVFAAITLGVFVLVGSVVYLELARQVNAQDDQDIVLAARHARRLGEEMHSLADLQSHSSRLISLVLGNRMLSIDIQGDDGRSIAAFNSDTMSRAPATFAGVLKNRVPASDRIAADAITNWHSPDNHRSVRALAAKIALQDGTQVTVIIQRDMFDHWLLLDHYRDLLNIVGLCGVLLSFAISYLLVRTSLVPLRDIAQSASAVTIDQLSRRIDVEDAPPELAALAASLNAMLMRLDTGFRRLSQFTTDLAHDMRTPLSNMRGATEVALSRPRSTEEYQVLLASNVEECDRLSRMIENVLFLGRAEHPQFAPRTRIVDIHEELDRIAAYFEGLTDDAGITLAVSAHGLIEADVELFRRAVSNLLANAVRYTPPSGTISIDSQSNSETLTVIVANDGEPIARDQLERIFDRFYRIDPSRHTDSTSSGASGLGLAIVRTIMDLHGGRVFAESDHSGTKFFLVFKQAT